MKRIVSYQEYRGLVAEVCNQIAKTDWRPDYIVGLTRGGLLPAVMISQYFDIPMHALKISLRDHVEHENNLWMAEDAYGKGDNQCTYKKILVVEDLNDTGSTLNYLMDDWMKSTNYNDPEWGEIWNHNVRFAVMFDKLSSGCRVKMDYVGEELDEERGEDWIVFPYEDWWR
jgi:uncharacterized protein